MPYTYLQKLFGETKEGEEPKAMTYAELEAAIDAAQDINLANLKEGGYVSKNKYDSKDEELTATKKLLEDANAQIKTFGDTQQTLESVKQSASDWEAKYKTDTQALQDKLAAQARSHAEDMFFTNYEFTSKAARNGVLADFRAKNFQLTDDGEFQGGKEYMTALMQEDDYKGAFKLPEEPAPEPETPPQPEPAPAPRFAQSTTAGTLTPTRPKIGLAELMRRKNENPNYNVTYD